MAANGTGDIPLQLVKAGPATRMGAMQGVSYIRCLNTNGGTAPGRGCDTSAKGQERPAAYPVGAVFYGAR